MRIACPKCGAEYEVPDAMLASGPRVLKCARCEHRFQAEAPRTAPPAAREPDVTEVPATDAASRERPPPPQPEAVAPQRSPPPEPVPTRPPPTRGPSQRSPIDAVAANPPPGGAALAVAWLLSVAVLGGVGYAAFLYRAEIMQAWPPATRLFAALGLA